MYHGGRRRWVDWRREVWVEGMDWSVDWRVENESGIDADDWERVS